MKQKNFIHNLSAQPTLKREDTEGGRFYLSPNGSRLPSVTTVLGWQGKDKLIEWRKRVGEEEATRISQKASTRGTKLHAICEDYLANKEIDFKKLDVGTIDLFASVIDIIDDTIDDIHAIETPLYSEHLGVAGTVDCIAKFRNKLSIIDWKTSNRPKKKEWIDNYFMQASCYAVMYEERTGNPVSQLVIIIAVDNDYPQIFVEKRDDWIGKAINIIDSYYAYHGLTDGRRKEI
jgi:PD-(D/E)XK nuclease superfamily